MPTRPLVHSTSLRGSRGEGRGGRGTSGVVGGAGGEGSLRVWVLAKQGSE